jgi:peptide/nickel transport system permease protein
MHSQAGALLLPAAPASARRSPLTTGWILALRRRPLAALVALMLLGIIALALAAPVVAPYDPLAQNSRAVLARPSAQYPFGTDQLGRDILSRLIWGTQTTLAVGLMTVGIATVVGTVLGLLSGYFGSWVDFALQRSMDTLMAFPPIVLAIAVVSVLGTGSINVALALGVVYTPTVNRIVRAATLAIREQLYVEGARAIGCDSARIMLRYIAPNVFPSILVVGTLFFGQAIVAEASLSFLGLGTQPPYPSLGGMLSGSARSYLLQAPWLAIYPGVLLAVVVLSFNLLGDVARDLLDPRLRHRA